ncbi:MAG: slipin family protein [Candidatus Omnitrophica bacterium]|nr:slipin family protein [Candidatus Omnitrophota bacterium]
MIGSPFMFVALIVFYVLSCIKILNEYERAVIFRLGRVLDRPKGPGMIIVLWPIDRAVKVSMRLVTMDIPPQDIITRDNVSVKINAVTYYRIVDPIKAIVEIENFHFAILQMAQTTLRSVIGQSDLDDLLAQREKINNILQEILDKQTGPWGIKVAHVEVKDVDLSEELRRAMARQAEAERERRAKVIAAEGEFQAAQKICEAGEMMQKVPVSLQLRYLQTLVEIGGKNNNTTTFFPVPIDLFKIFTEKH